jgi:hypothetical protein
LSRLFSKFYKKTLEEKTGVFRFSGTKKNLFIPQGLKRSSQSRGFRLGGARYSKITTQELNFPETSFQKDVVKSNTEYYNLIMMNKQKG